MYTILFDDYNDRLKIKLAVVCKQRILRFFGHIIRDGSSLEKLIVKGNVVREKEPRKITNALDRSDKFITGYPLEAAIRSANVNYYYCQRLSKGH